MQKIGLRVLNGEQDLQVTGESPMRKQLRCALLYTLPIVNKLPDTLAKGTKFNMLIAAVSAIPADTAATLELTENAVSLP